MPIRWAEESPPGKVENQKKKKKKKAYEAELNRSPLGKAELCL